MASDSKIYIPLVLTCLQECVLASVYQSMEGMCVMLTSPGRSINDSAIVDLLHTCCKLLQHNYLPTWDFTLTLLFNFIYGSFLVNSYGILSDLLLLICGKTTHLLKFKDIMKHVMEQEIFNISPFKKKQTKKTNHTITWMST